MFKTEAHAHVSETSACSFLSASEMVSLYHKAGSDTHQTEDVALCGILSENEIRTSEDFIALIENRKGEIFIA